DRSDGHPALAIVDLKMPRVGGIDILRQVKSDADLKTLPIVVMTSSREERDVCQAYELGANGYVVKPVRFHDLVEAGSHIGGLWTVTNEPPPEPINAGAGSAASPLP